MNDFAFKPVIITLGDIMAEFEHVDDPDVFERMKSVPVLRDALEMLRPENWWGTGLNPEALFTIAKDDGIPVVWVPPSDILCELVRASDYETRISLLLSKKQEIVNHCKLLIQSCNDPYINDIRLLAEKALAAYEDGHHETSMALAANISEPLAITASTPLWSFFTSEEEKVEWNSRRKAKGKYGWAALELESGIEKDGYNVMPKILIAPIIRFFTPYYPENAGEIPLHLSRHAVVHQPTLQHFSPGNALLSLMLVASLLYACQLRYEEIRSMDRA